MATCLPVQAPVSCYVLPFEETAGTSELFPGMSRGFVDGASGVLVLLAGWKNWTRGVNFPLSVCVTPASCP